MTVTCWHAHVWREVQLYPGIVCIVCTLTLEIICTLSCHDHEAQTAAGQQLCIANGQQPTLALAGDLFMFMFVNNLNHVMDIGKILCPLSICTNVPAES